MGYVELSPDTTVSPATVAPLMDGTAAVGTTTKYAREDHIHPIDTSRAPLASPVFTGDPQAPTPTAGDSDTSIATTGFVANAMASLGVGGMSTAEYNYIATTTPPPSSGQLRGNSATQSAITAFYLHESNALGVDITNALKIIAAGVKILVQDKTNSANVQYYVTSGPAVDNGVYFTIPVTWTSTGSGTSFTAGRVIFAAFGIGSNNTSATGDNVLLNGDFRINQGAYVSAAVLAAGAYGHDQWKAGASGGDYSFTQLLGSTQITIAAGKTLIQPVEDIRVVGGSYVLSWTGTAQARAGVNTLTPSGSYAASPLLIAAQTAGTVMSVEFNAGTLGTVKLEPGSAATPFVMTDYAQELLACRRYFEVMGQGLTGFSNSTTAVNMVLRFTVQKRAAPTITQNTTTPGIYTTIAGYSTGSGTALTALSGPDAFGGAVIVSGFTGLSSPNYSVLSNQPNWFKVDARL